MVKTEKILRPRCAVNCQGTGYISTWCNEVQNDFVRCNRKYERMSAPKMTKTIYLFNSVKTDNKYYSIRPYIN